MSEVISMAECDFCEREMADGTGCTSHMVSGIPRVPYGMETRDALSHLHQGGVSAIALLRKYRAGCLARPCHDCKAPTGTFHHPGCDVEECPVCGYQTITCGCDIDIDIELKMFGHPPSDTDELERLFRSRLNWGIGR